MSVADYQDKLRIGGGKKRMASLLTPEFVAAAGLPADPAGQQDAIAAWHRRKTAIYAELVAAGAVLPRPGIARIVAEALAGGLAGGRRVNVSRTIGRGDARTAVGAENAREVKVFAGDIVSRKKPAPDIYLLALDSLGLPADRVVVVEDSRNGLLAATGAGTTRMITVNDFTVARRLQRGRASVCPPVATLVASVWAVLATRSLATLGRLDHAGGPRPSCC